MLLDPLLLLMIVTLHYNTLQLLKFITFVVVVLPSPEPTYAAGWLYDYPCTAKVPAAVAIFGFPAESAAAYFKFFELLS